MATRWRAMQRRPIGFFDGQYAPGASASRTGAVDMFATASVLSLLLAAVLGWLVAFFVASCLVRGMLDAAGGAFYVLVSSFLLVVAVEIAKRPLMHKTKRARRAASWRPALAEPGSLNHTTRPTHLRWFDPGARLPR